MYRNLSRQSLVRRQINDLLFGARNIQRFPNRKRCGYINNFHTDTDDIAAMHNYKGNLSIYKKNKVYLLTGSSPDDFSIVPFADKGTTAANTVVNVDNKQYFLSNGIYALEQVGELNQIRLGSSISNNITPEFENFDSKRLKKYPDRSLPKEASDVVFVPL